ncbi:accessory Sec system glycosyltransferase Asp1 [Gracilibacillus alcaliphilus]|uniref:accessory Sec system glycosyltransferase Asp1 n=1 Tax=Gracilibacillus alcaliphilus TaxID=1401441 RepID=UPI00195DEE8E|nr:accessory Sec system glycosyltransferase Asp1 [Gracilibacillus alcaliphilus]MBM7677143.1 glycosyltransferase involved in cell wall biosynthesis [Gracilibacillus alcaliphilus]
MQKKRIYFLHSDVGKSLTGIEKSAMVRANLFINHLDIVPTFITAKKNRNIQENWERYAANKVVDSRIPMINLYDHLQKTAEGRNLPSYEVPKETRYGYAKVNTKNKDQIHYRVFNSNNQLVKYIVYHLNHHVHYINYFHDGKKIYREHFNRYGQLSHTEYLREDNSVYLTEYFDVYGKRVLIKHDKGPILVASEYSALETILNSEQELILYFLQKIIPDEAIIIVDRNRLYSSIFTDMKQLDAKVVTIIHSTYFSEREYRSKINVNYQKVLNSPYSFDHIITLTDRQKQDIEEQFGIKNLVTIPHPSPNLTVSQTISVQPKKLLSIGRLAPEKNIDHMLEILALIKKEIPEVILELYGNGKEEKTLKQLAKKLGVEENVMFKGYVDNLSDLYASSDMFLFTGQAEGFAMSVLESLSAGCPVCSYDVRYGVNEMIQDDKNGFLIEFGDKQTFADQVITYLKKTEAEKKQYRHLAKETVSDYTEAKIAAKWKQLIDHLSE